MKTLLQAAKTAPSAEYFKGYRDGLRLDVRKDAELSAEGDTGADTGQLAQLIVTALEDGYTSGVEALLSYAREGNTIYGRFRDGAKTFGYTLSDGQISYWLLKGPQRADSLDSPPIWRADKILAKKKKSENAGKGVECGRGYISPEKNCRFKPSPKAKKNIAKAAKLIDPFSPENNPAFSRIGKATAEVDPFSPKNNKAFPGNIKDAPKEKKASTSSIGTSSSPAKSKKEHYDRLAREIEDRTRQIKQTQKVSNKVAEQRAQTEVFSERIQQRYGVDDPEKAARWASALVDFTGDNFQTIRSVEAGEKVMVYNNRTRQNLDRAKKSVKSMQEMLAEAPKAEGAVFRGLSFKNDLFLQDFMESIQGGTMELNAMSSFSSDQSIVQVFAKSDKKSGARGVVLRCSRNRSGVDISELSIYPHEAEVLVPKGTRYKVNGITTGKDGRIYIDIEED